MSRAKLLSIVALIGGPAFGVYTHNEIVQRREVQEKGATVAGVVEGGEVRTRKGRKSYELKVAFQTKEGQKLTKEFSVPNTFAEKYVKDKNLIRDDVEVRYLPADPNKSFLVGAGDGNPELEYVGYGIGALGLVGTAFTFRRRREEVA